MTMLQKPSLSQKQRVAMALSVGIALLGASFLSSSWLATARKQVSMAADHSQGQLHPSRHRTDSHEESDRVAQGKSPLPHSHGAPVNTHELQIGFESLLQLSP